MSISGSDETKSAILQQSAAAGTDEEAQLDAQEDREIVGYSTQSDIDPEGAAPDLGRARIRIHIGTSQFQEQAFADVPETDVRDNASFHVPFQASAEDDDTNNKAAAGDSSEAVWFGKGSGIEWNEDATLTVQLSPVAGDAVATVVVYYREL